MLGHCPRTGLLLALACCTSYVLAAADAHPRSDVSWLIQLSDLHISAHVHHDIVPDLFEFGDRVIRTVKPGAILITGDLVDAKTRVEGSQQNEAEWKAYETVWRHLAQSADLAAAAVLDVRGNHDAFDTSRNTDQDLFAFHSATAAAHGQAAAAAQRVWVHELQPQLLLPTPHQQQQQQQQQHWRPKRNKRGLQMLGSSSRRVMLQNVSRNDPEHQQQQQHHAGSGPHISHRSLSAFRTAAASSSSLSCPSAVLLGLDFTPNVGLHAPANFFGVATGPLLQQIQQQLLLIRTGSSSSSSGEADQAAAGFAPISGTSVPKCRHTVPVISYSHYPFSTVAGSYAPSSSIRQQRQQQREGGRAVRDLLRRYDVSAHVSGHLHDLVGQRLHAIYDKPLGTAAAAAAAEGDGSSSAAAAAAAGAYLTDLESADWKTARRWRLILVDSGVLSFADLQFKRTPCSSSSSDCSGGTYTVRSVDSSRSVMSHLAVLTWPPDGRYSPLSAAAAQQQQQDWATWQQQQQQDGGSVRSVLLLPVRVWVAPLDLQGNFQAGSSSSSSSSSGGVSIADVQLHYGCRRVTGQQSLSSSSSRRMHPIGTTAKTTTSSSGNSGGEEYPYSLTGPQVFGTHVSLDPHQLLLLCGSDSSSSTGVVLQLQVIVTDTAGSVSTSELRPVLLPLNHWQQQQQQQEQGSALPFPIAAAAAARLPLGNGLFEWLIIVFDGISFGYWLFYTGWLCQVVGLLLLPKLLGRHILSAHTALWRAVAGSSSSSSKKDISTSRSFLGTNKQQQQQQLDDVLTPDHKKALHRSSSSSSRGLRRHSLIIALLLQAMATAAALLIRTVRSILLLLLLLLLLPAAAMAVLAQHHRGLWYCMLGHALFVQWGPWFVAQMSSSSSGLGVWFRYGLLLPLPVDLAAAWVGGDPLLPPEVAAAAAALGSNDVQQQYVWLPTPDTYTMSSLFMCLVLAPATLWFGLVVSAWHQAAATQVICNSSNGSSAATAGELELAAAPVDTESTAAKNEGIVTNAYSSSSSSMNSMGRQPQQQRGGLAGSGTGNHGSSSSSGPERVLSRTRSNTQGRARASLELPITAGIADSGDCNRRDAALVTSSGSSSAIKSGDLYNQEDETDELLPAAAAATGALAPAAAAAAVIGGITRTGSAWLINLLPLGLVPGVAAAAAAAPAAAVTSPTARSAAAAAAAAANAFIKLPKPKLKITTLIPTLLWYVMGIVVLVLRIVGRAFHMFLMATRLPVHLLLLLLPIAYLWYRCCWRLGAAYGATSLLVSPVIGWLPVFVILAMRHVRKQLAAVEARRNE